MQIALIEPYYTGSHAQWVNGLLHHCANQIKPYTLEGRHWKWRMHGGGITLADRIVQGDIEPDLFLVTSMCDLNAFVGALPKTLRSKPFVYYFHENQLTYPMSPRDTDIHQRRDLHYAFIQIASAHTADEVWFNTGVHRDQFLDAAEEYLQKMPDHRLKNTVHYIRKKSKVMHLGLELNVLNAGWTNSKRNDELPILLWNHRWEYDKGPDAFFECLFRLKDENIAFRLVVVGESFDEQPPVFETARDRLAAEIVHWGYCESREAYAEWLHKAHLLPVTSRHDFFGISVVEAAFCGVRPLLPYGLSYNEHFDDPNLFYRDGMFHDQLKRILLGNEWKSPFDADFLQRYDWDTMAPRYDLAFEEVTEQS